MLEQSTAPRCVAFATATVKMDDEWRERKVRYAFDEPWLYDLCKQRDGKPEKEGAGRLTLRRPRREALCARFRLALDERAFAPSSCVN